MKTFLINIGIILGIIFAYWLDIFGWFTGKAAFWLGIILVAAVFIAALKVLGNPFAGDKKDD